MGSREGPHSDREHGDSGADVNVAEEQCRLLRWHPEKRNLYAAEHNEPNKLLGGHICRRRERVSDVSVAGKYGIQHHTCHLATNPGLDTCRIRLSASPSIISRSTRINLPYQTKHNMILWRRAKYDPRRPQTARLPTENPTCHCAPHQPLTMATAEIRIY